MKKTIGLLPAILVCLSVSPLFGAAQATLINIQGKVEVKPVTGNWTVAKEGMKVDLMDTISTGFNSTAELKLEDNIVQVSPLTRLTLDKLLEQNGKLSTSLYLKVGKVTTNVKSSKGLAQDFKVQSPYSTASVRGTKFVFDGVSLRVIEGNVQFVLGAPKRDFTQYVNKMLREQYGYGDETIEESDQTFTIDILETVPQEEVLAIVNDVVGALVQTGEMTGDEAGDLVNQITETIQETISQNAPDNGTTGGNLQGDNTSNGNQSGNNSNNNSSGDNSTGDNGTGNTTTDTGTNVQNVSAGNQITIQPTTVTPPTTTGGTGSQPPVIITKPRVKGDVIIQWKEGTKK